MDDELDARIGRIVRGALSEITEAIVKSLRAQMLDPETREKYLGKGVPLSRSFLPYYRFLKWKLTSPFAGAGYRATLGWAIIDQEADSLDEAIIGVFREEDFCIKILAFLNGESNG